MGIPSRLGVQPKVDVDQLERESEVIREQCKVDLGNSERACK